MRDKAVGGVAKRSVGVQRGDIRKAHEASLVVAHSGETIKGGAEAKSISQAERVEEALRPAERTDVDNLIMMMLVFLVVLLVVLRGQPHWNRQHRE